MAKKSSDVVAGGASVRVSADVTPFKLDIGKAESWLKTFGKNAVALGAKFAGFGSVLGTGILGAAKSFAHAGTELDDLSNRTGDSVKNLSELKYAAGKLGATVEDLQGGLTDMASNLGKAFGGDPQMMKNISKLGLTTQQLKGKLPTEQLKMLATAISKLSDNNKKIDLAKMIFGGSGVKLLPLLDQGEAGIAKLTAEAQKLGLVMSNEDAAAAAKLDDEFKTLSMSVEGIINKVGSALTPAVSEVVNYLTEAATSVAKFAGENRSLIAGAGVVTAGIVAAGAAIGALGTISYVAGAGIGALTAVSGVLTSVLSVQNAVWLVQKVAVTASAVAVGIYQGALTGLSGVFLITKGVALAFSVACGAVSAIMTVSSVIAGALSAAYTAITFSIGFVNGALGLLATGLGIVAFGKGAATVATVAYNAALTAMTAVSGLASAATAVLSGSITGVIIPFALGATAIWAVVSAAGALFRGFLSLAESAAKFAGDAVKGLVSVRDTAFTVFGGIVTAGRTMLTAAVGFFGDLLGTAQSTFKGISDAVAGGNIQLGMEILMAGIKVAWVKATEAVIGVWETAMVHIRGLINTLAITIKAAFDVILINIEGGFDQLLTKVGAKIATFMKGHATLMNNLNPFQSAKDKERNKISIDNAHHDATKGDPAKREADRQNRIDEIRAKEKKDLETQNGKQQQALQKLADEQGPGGPSTALMSAESKLAELQAMAKAVFMPSPETIERGKRNTEAGRAIGSQLQTAEAHARNSAGAASTIAKAVNGPADIAGQTLAATKEVVKQIQNATKAIEKNGKKPPIELREQT